MTKEILAFNPENVGVAITTFYPEYNELNSSDRVRGDLALSLIKKTQSNGFAISIVDGGSNEEFLTKAKGLKAEVTPQTMSGMDGSRFQAYEVISQNTNVRVVNWIEAEKAPLISSDLLEANKLILSNKTKMIVPARSEVGMDSLPKFQKLSEQSANTILDTTLNRYKREHNLFPQVDQIPVIDWFFGPKIFDIKLIDQFKNETPFWKEFIGYLNRERPELKKAYGYCGPLILPAVLALHIGLPVKSYEMKSYRHPTKQTELESNLPEDFLTKRIQQLANINLTVERFCYFLTLHPEW